MVEILILPIPYAPSPATSTPTTISPNTRMKFAVLTVAALLAAATAAPLSEEQYQFLFSKFSAQFNKNYAVENVFSKYQTFKNNVDLIVAHNASGQQTYKMEINKFADMTASEFNQFMGLKVVEEVELVPFNNYTERSTIKATQFEEVDWVKSGAVVAPKDQGQCGSCWAFATTGALEPAMRIAKKGDKKLDLSEQYLVDCSGSYGNNGCSGGLMSNAFEFIKSTGGMPATADYPYTAKDGKCNKTVELNKKANPTGYTKVGTSDDAHMEALKKGPVAVALAASSSAFQFYKSGVVSNCTDRSINHGVTLVATGTEAGKQFYRIRNS
jgi:C1A family cysteine protease